MSIITVHNKTIQLKIVYYGPEDSGKTSSIKSIGQAYHGDSQSDIISLKTKEGNTLFFDFLPVDMKTIDGYRVRTLLYTIPGHVKYDVTRKLVLNGVDAIVFVADSRAVCRQANKKSLEQLKDSLSQQNKDLTDIPLVMQYNKSDLSDQGIPLLSFETLEIDLNQITKAPAYKTSSAIGNNILAVFRKITSMALADAHKNLADQAPQ
ncbi:MAG: gliding motility protein [Desulfobulbaceae bacterium]|nr:gliding motility protein [Desulfobulbaceae bacterium]